MVIVFLTCFSSSGDFNQPQIGTRKDKSMALLPRCYKMLAKAAKHQSPDAADHEVNDIGR